MTIRITFLLGIMAFAYLSSAQQLKPGFDKAECLDLMRISAQFGDSSYREALPVPEGYTLVYDSPVMGLENKWSLSSDNKNSSPG